MPGRRATRGRRDRGQPLKERMEQPATLGRLPESVVQAFDAAKKPVANADLWQDLIAAARPHRIAWQWVKGHAGNPDNERADQLASAAAELARATRSAVRSNL